MTIINLNQAEADARAQAGIADNRATVNGAAKPWIMYAIIAAIVLFIIKR